MKVSPEDEVSGSETGGAEAKGQMIEGFTSQGKIEMDFSKFPLNKEMSLALRDASVLRAFVSWERIRKLSHCVGDITGKFAQKTKPRVCPK